MVGTELMSGPLQKVYDLSIELLLQIWKIRAVGGWSTLSFKDHLSRAGKKTEVKTTFSLSMSPSILTSLAYLHLLGPSGPMLHTLQLLDSQ